MENYQQQCFQQVSLSSIIVQNTIEYLFMFEEIRVGKEWVAESSAPCTLLGADRDASDPDNKDGTQTAARHGERRDAK